MHIMHIYTIFSRDFSVLYHFIDFSFIPRLTSFSTINTPRCFGSLLARLPALIFIDNF